MMTNFTMQTAGVKVIVVSNRKLNLHVFLLNLCLLALEAP